MAPATPLRSTPSPRLPVGILGATGTVGQRLVSLLSDHPWFEVTTVMASERSVGKPYGEAAAWHLPGKAPDAAAALTVTDCRPRDDLALVFSALQAGPAHELEAPWADAGALVVSNASAHRMDAGVPLIVPEVNADHIALLPHQDTAPGGLLTNPNCSTIGLVLALAPLHRAFGVRAVHVVTLQALSGAGLPGVPASAMADNVIPFIPNEEDKLGAETGKLLGRVAGGVIDPAALAVSAQCNRVAVSDGHLLCVSVGFEKPADSAEVRSAWESFTGPADVARLPSAPERPLIVLDDPDAPQPRLHRDLERGMAASVGRLRPCPLLDQRFVALSHNTVRGAAGGALLLAELAAARGHVRGFAAPA